MIKVISYECHDSCTEVVINICGKKYRRKISVSSGKSMPDCNYWRTHENEYAKMALGLILQHEIEENDVRAIREIERLRSTL